MRLFKKHLVNTGASDKAAGCIAKVILKLQEKFAHGLESISGSWKRKQQWMFLYLVCLVFGGLSVLVIVKSFSKRSPVALARPAAISAPRSIPDDGGRIKITDSEIRKVQVFKESLDSTSKKKLEQRPGLIDSLAMLEQLYYSQKKER